MGTAGYLSTFAVSEDGTTYNTVGGCNNGNMPFARAMLEVTEFGDSAVDRISGLADQSATVSGHYIGSDTAQAALIAGLQNGTDVYVRWLPDGTNGFVVRGKVENFEVSAGVDATVEFSCTVQGVAGFTTVSI